MLGGQVYNGSGSGNPLGGDDFDQDYWLGLAWADEDTWAYLASFFEDNSYDASELFIEEKGDEFVLSLSDEDWDLITAIEQRVFLDDGEGYDYWYSCGTVPILYDGKDAELVLMWDSDNPYGYVVGWRYTVTGSGSQRGLFDLWDGMYFDFLCDYYTCDGEYDDQYQGYRVFYCLFIP